jgi:hypothetical protein
MIMFSKKTMNSRSNILLQVKLKALTMEEKIGDLQWDVVHDIV